MSQYNEFNSKDFSRRKKLFIGLASTIFVFFLFSPFPSLEYKQVENLQYICMTPWLDLDEARMQNRHMCISQIVEVHTNAELLAMADLR